MTRPSRSSTIRVGVLRDVRLVGDDDDGQPLVVELLEERQTSTVVWLSRLPVGSSASSSDGSVTRARAMATRCCWPPDSSLGWCSSRLAKADALEGGCGEFPRVLRPSTRGRREAAARRSPARWCGPAG